MKTIAATLVAALLLHPAGLTHDNGPPDVPQPPVTAQWHVHRPVLGFYDPRYPWHRVFARQINRELRPGLIQVYDRFNYYTRHRVRHAFVPVPTLRLDHSHGQITLIDLDPDTTVNGQQVPVTARAILAGKWDTYLRSYADKIRSLGFQVAIAYAHEANGFWYTWGYRFTKPWTYVRMWRHVWRIFHQEGADNVTWVWTINRVSPEHAPSRMKRITRRQYPGSKYVDWVGIDGYFRNSPQLFADRFGGTLRWLSSFSDQPVFITETAVYPNPSEKTQIWSLFAGIKAWHLLGFMYFNHPEQRNWALTQWGYKLLARRERAYHYVKMRGD